MKVTINGRSGVFFDQTVVTSAADNMVNKGLSKAGAFIRTTAKGSLRYSRKSAVAGQPPKVKRGGSVGYQRTTINKKTGATVRRSASPLKELIYFAKSGDTVIVGPMDFKGSRTNRYKVPTVLERGGTGQRIDGKKVKVLKFKGNPFMRPALAKVAPNIPAMLKGEFKPTKQAKKQG